MQLKARVSYHLLNNLVRNLESKVMFYPCSALDINEPVSFFVPYLTDFWFVDINYFRSGIIRLFHPSQNLPSLKYLGSSNEIIEMEESDWKQDRLYCNTQPSIWTEHYTERETGLEIRLNFCNRRAPSALRYQIDRLGMFFYRGDSSEGSSPEWFRCWGKTCLIHEILNKMPTNSLIVTDGSKCKDTQYQPFIQIIEENVQPELFVQKIQPFTDRSGNSFQCVGYAGKRRDRHSYIWQVIKNQ
jgi:hypothetical protein